MELASDCQCEYAARLLSEEELMATTVRCGDPGQIFILHHLDLYVVFVFLSFFSIVAAAV